MPRPSVARRGGLGLDAVAELGTVVGVWAHPDDEAYLAAGLMAALTDAGRRVVSVCATLGEKGLESLPVDEARRRRGAELRAALAQVGVDEVHVLGYADGACADADPDEAADAVAAVLTDVAADTVVTFGPEGMTGHADHRAVSRWATAAVQLSGSQARLLHATMTPEHVRETADTYARFAVMIEGEPPVTAREDLAVHLDLEGPVLARKMSALRAHHTQTAALREALGEGGYAAFVAQESFVDARDEHGG